jgi:hypothetical protein
MQGVVAEPPAMGLAVKRNCPNPHLTRHPMVTPPHQPLNSKLIHLGAVVNKTRRQPSLITRQMSGLLALKTT